MKISKTIKTEVLQVYETWLHSYLNGDVATYDSYFDKDYHFIGSTNNEEFLNREDTTKFFGDTAEQFAGKCDLRNEKRTLEQFGELIFITHSFDAWFLNGNDYSYYERFRFSSALRKNSEGWQFIYQHFSTPDSNTDEGETIGFDKISEENTKLRDAIKRRTVELEAKNRDLEIEGALGRIRAQAVAMKESADLLDILVTMRNEFTQLGHEAQYFWHMMWLPSTYEKAMTSGDGTRIGFVMELPKHIHGDIPLIAKWEKSDEPVVIFPMDTEAAIAYVDKMVSLGDFKNIDPQAPTHDDIRHIKGLTFIMARTSHGEIGYSLPGVVKNPPAEDLELLVRFAGAFDLAHRRFLDLQKAESQARETQVELALEKVRSRSMAMQHSNELNQVIESVSHRLIELDIEFNACSIITLSKSTDKLICWFASNDENKYIKPFHLPNLDMPIIQDSWNGFNSKREIFSKTYPYKEKNEFFKYLFKHTDFKLIPKDRQQLMLKSKAYGACNTFTEHSGIQLNRYNEQPFTNKEHEIIARFGKVFEQSYIRFLDLQKAEAQAKEAQIEAALEKVRSRSLAMQKSEELNGVIKLVYYQLVHLNIKLDHAGFVVDYTPQGDWHFWIADEQEIPSKITHPFFESVWANQYNEAKEKGTDLFTTHLDFEAKNKFYEELLSYVSDISEEAKDFYMTCPGLGASTVLFDDIGLYIENFSGTAYSDEENAVLMRFGKVFQQTYTRFLDLQKAEAQAQEAKIQLALERVRARIMAMHESEELSDAAAEMFQQMADLSVTPERLNICFFNEEERTLEVWPTDEGGLATNKQFTASLDEPTTIFKAFTAWKEKKNSIIIDLHGEELKEWVAYVREAMGLTIKEETLNDRRIHSMAFFSHGMLMTTSSQPIPDKSFQLLERFTQVFDQAYIRFLDLQKAEAQAKEAQVEAALERVRARTMAMQGSEELADVAFVLFEQIRGLGGNLWGTGFGLCKSDSELDEFWFANEKGVFPPVSIPNSIDSAHKQMYNGWKTSKDYLAIEGSGNELKSHYNNMMSLPEVRPFFQKILDEGLSFPEWQQWSAAYFKHGYLLIITLETYPDPEILKRFAKVFDQTYTRFLDLQKAEARARESQIETALERVRSRTMGMQKSEELGDVATVLFSELNGLVDNLWTCGFVLCEGNRQEDEWWLSMDSGFTRGIFLPNVEDHAHATLYEGWKTKEAFRSVILDGDDLQTHYDWLMKIPVAKKTFEDMEAAGIARPVWQKLHAAYFKTGYLVIITEVPCGEEEIFKRFAQAFDLTYTRFLDLQKKEEQAKKLVEEKIRLEQTLKDLQATQSQLVQAEKMASLGELTAGIAHEIQNPLNFVNNFSEVSGELIDEMAEEIANGDLEEATAIAADIKGNLEKITHHGKRADAIVKGMLAHSRAGKGEKAPTDLNALADEYLRLSYHGLRAKDKSFNADLKTDFDPNLPMVSVVTQDIGRVILNLINNAFQACASEGIKNPTVTVSSTRVDFPSGKEGSAEAIQITVTDNGPGIPDAIKDKIFQPFFTTKPTGEGTGLGLSLSYDIVKAHGGTLEVESKSGQGTTFTILLPLAV